MKPGSASASGITAAWRVVVSFLLVADVTALSITSAGADVGTIAFAPIIFFYTGAIILLLALPAYLIIRIRWRETWLGCIGAGFLIGATAAALVLLPASGSLQVGPEMMVVAGMRKAAGWRMFATVVGIAGGIGAGAGGVFWAALRSLETPARWPRLGHLPLTAGTCLAIATTGAILAIPSLTKDRSCHNVLRDGRSSIQPVLFFTVELNGGEWPRLHHTAQRFALAEGWSTDESNEKDKAFSRRQFVSACIEPGTAVTFYGMNWSDPGLAEISVFQPQGGDSWREPARRLLSSIQFDFPGRLRRDLTGSKEVQTPSTLMPQP